VELLLGLDEINRSDLYGTPTDTVRQLTGHSPRTVEEYIERNRAAFLIRGPVGIRFTMIEAFARADARNLEPARHRAA
jgi:hypothetical protein